MSISNFLLCPVLSSFFPFSLSSLPYCKLALQASCQHGIQQNGVSEHQQEAKVRRWWNFLCWVERVSHSWACGGQLLRCGGLTSQKTGIVFTVGYEGNVLGGRVGCLFSVSYSELSTDLFYLGAGPCHSCSHWDHHSCNSHQECSRREGTAHSRIDCCRPEAFRFPRGKHSTCIWDLEMKSRGLYL